MSCEFSWIGVGAAILFGLVFYIAVILPMQIMDKGGEDIEWQKE